jgi:diguanylate cyclase (GGDEF)-like protein
MDGMSHSSRKTVAPAQPGPPDAQGLTPQATNRVLPFHRRRYPRKETLESVISSALRLEDNELDKILSTLEDLSKIAKSQHFDAVAMDEALKKAAIWAVKQSLLDREIRSLAITDDLTGLFNRRGFLAAATQQLKLAHRDRQNVLLLFCDLDHLKNINDTFGHKEGDLALVRTADALEETFRNSDVLSRLGGDEFAVLAWEASIPDLRTILTRLERNLLKANADEPRFKLSLSIGVARYDPHFPLSLSELMARADQDMYRHKNRRAYAASQKL